MNTNTTYELEICGAGLLCLEPISVHALKVELVSLVVKGTKKKTMKKNQKTLKYHLFYLNGGQVNQATLTRKTAFDS